MLKTTLILFSTLLVIASSQLQAQSLAGSRDSINRQYQTALSYGYSFIESSKSIPEFVNAGELIRVPATSNLVLHDVSYPYARAELKLFLDRLSQQYRSACKEKLTVTSLARPLDRQPANAADNSVHPTGMAVDLRIPPTGSCRNWLERTLLSLEASDVLDVTRERNPPHYHVALFTQSYASYLANRAQTAQEYVVRPGDSLWVIASRTGASVAQIRSANGLSGDLINVGQRLQIPTGDIPARATASLNETPILTADVSHKVRRGDTLWKLANRYGSSVQKIQSDNSLSGINLQIGQVLRIRGATANI